MNMSKYMVRELVELFHEVELDDELNIEKVVNLANENQKLYDSGYEAIGNILLKYKQHYGFEYHVNPRKYGTNTITLDIVDEME